MVFSSIFEEEGYLLCKSLIKPDLCDQVRNSFKNEIKPWPGALLRQRTVAYENHRFSKNGNMVNPLLDVHRMDRDLFDDFTSAVYRMFSDIGLNFTLSQIMGNDPVLIQTMYFESSKGTTPHFDHFFVSEQNNGKMFGIWVALEDIKPDAGQFYLYPKSHLLENVPSTSKLKKLFDEYTELNVNNANLKYNHKTAESFKLVMRTNYLRDAIIEEADWEKYQPTIKKGDVLIFDSKILHGSDRPIGAHSRNSITAHFISYNESAVVRYGDKYEKLNVEHIGPLMTHMSNRYPIAPQISIASH